MAYTGYQQGVIAFKARTTDGAPLDINGQPTSESGLKQAIALLSGWSNPNPALYVVEFYFTAGAVVTGNPTTVYNPVLCTAGFMEVSPTQLIFDNTNLVPRDITILASGAWVVDSIETAIAGIFTLSATAGNSGSTTITASTTLASALGQGYIYFKNTETGQIVGVYFIHTADASVWVLATHAWNMLGFWQNSALWGV